MSVVNVHVASESLIFVLSTEGKTGLLQVEISEKCDMS